MGWLFQNEPTQNPLQHLIREYTHEDSHGKTEVLDGARVKNTVYMAVRSTYKTTGAQRFGGAAGDYLPLHVWFLSTGAWFDFKDPRHLAMRHHSFGIFEAETRFGVVLKPPNCPPVPTRIVAERHVRAVLGRVPAASDFLLRVKGALWMAAAQSRPPPRLH